MSRSSAPAGLPARTFRFPRTARLLALTVLAAASVTAVLAGPVPAPAEAATTVRVMPLGDSITGSPGCWRQLLWSRLQNSGYSHVDFVGTLDTSQSCGTPFDGQNEGHGGFLATNILRDNQLPGWLSATRPDVVMLQLGTNDVWNNIAPSTLLNTTFSGLVAQMRAQNPAVRVVVAKITPMNPSNCSDCGQRVVNFNNAIPAWAAGISTAASPVTVVDLWTGFSTASDTGDGVHPNAAGNQKLATSWYPALTAAVDSVGGTTPTSPVTTAPVTTAPVTTAPVTTAPVTTAPVTTAPGGRGCSATFGVGSSWGGGFVGSVKVTAGSAAISRWSVALTLPAGTTISNLWNGSLSGGTVSNAGWNGALAAGGSVEFGFQATGSASGTAVASCTAS